MVSRKDSNKARLARHKRVRSKISGTPARPRLCVYRSLANINAQIIDDVNGITLASASTLDKELKAEIENGGNKEAAKKVGEAVAILKNLETTCAEPILKTLNSAVANAHYQNEQNSELNVNLDALFVKSILIDGGTILKRMTPRAKGSGYKILKRTSHITIVVADSK